jgi:signal transduction histidine kinase
MKSWTVIDRHAFIAGVVALFVMVLTFVGAFVWLQSQVMDMHDRELRSTLLGELELRRQFDRTSGRQRLLDGLSWRSAIVDSTRHLVVLDPSGQSLVGDAAMIPLDSVEAVKAGKDFKTQDAAGVTTFVVGLPLDDGALLMMSYRDPVRLDMARTLGRTAVAVLLFIVIAGIVTGVVLNQYIVKQVRNIADTARSILRGQMTARAPVSQRVDEMGALASTFNEMLDQNEALVTGMRTVTESLAHDFRTPMMRVRKSIANARVAASDAERENHLNDAEAGVTRSLQTFNSLVDLARAEAGLSRGSMEVLDLGVLAVDLAELFEPLAEERGQTLERHIEPITINGHKQILAQAVGNLLENAIKYSPQGATLSLSVALAADGEPEIVVQDRGPGIPSYAREQAVRPFVRLETPVREQGSGLGLAIAAAVARLHRGRLVLENAEPGLRVRLQFGAV